MDQIRQVVLFRALVKDVVRRNGIRFQDNPMREITSEVKNFNERHNIQPPVEAAEFAELLVEIMKELTAEYFGLIERKVAELKKPAAK